MTDKATRTNTIFNEILENIRYTHDKNDYYKDSYSEMMKIFGVSSGLIRIYSKFNRLENIFNSDDGKVNFESAEDNLQDLATYAIMMLEYIKKGGDK